MPGTEPVMIDLSSTNCKKFQGNFFVLMCPLDLKIRSHGRISAFVYVELLQCALC